MNPWMIAKGGENSSSSSTFHMQLCRCGVAGCVLRRVCCLISVLLDQHRSGATAGALSMTDPEVVCLPEPREPWLGALFGSDKTANRSSWEIAL